MEVVVTSYKTCKASVKSSPTNKPTSSFLRDGCPFCRPTNSVRALKGVLKTIKKLKIEIQMEKYIFAVLLVTCVARWPSG